MTATRATVILRWNSEHEYRADVTDSYNEGDCEEELVDRTARNSGLTHITFDAAFLEIV